MTLPSRPTTLAVSSGPRGAPATPDGVTRILILGGGFGGLYAALELERTLARDPNVEVTLVSRENFFLFTPMLHEIAASDLDLTHIVNPLRKLLRRVRFFKGAVERIDLERREAWVTHGREPHAHALPYDHLVLALGSVTNFYGLEGLATHAITMKSLGDAIHLRNHLIGCLEEADPECCASRRAPLLTVVVAGGGFAGVETVAGVNDFLRESLAYYPNLRDNDLGVVLVHAGGEILPELGDELGAYARHKLVARGIDVRLGTHVTGADAAGVRLADGTFTPSATIVWTAGTAPNPLLASLPCSLERGRVVVGGDLAVPGWPGVWAVGDCAAVPDDASGTFQPPTAQHALRQGRHVARNIAATLRRAWTRPFAFSGLGQLAAIGKRTGVAKILGAKFSGFAAWWLWRTIYLSKLPGFEKKVRVMLD